MTAKEPIQCTWAGVGPDEDEEGRSCGKPAVGYALSADGHPWYSCEEHIGYAKERAGSGRFIHGTRPETRVPPPTPHAATAQARHNASVVGGVD